MFLFYRKKEPKTPNKKNSIRLAAPLKQLFVK